MVNWGRNPNCSLNRSTHSAHRNLHSLNSDPFHLSSLWYEEEEKIKNSQTSLVGKHVCRAQPCWRHITWYPGSWKSCCSALCGPADVYTVSQWTATSESTQLIDPGSYMFSQLSQIVQVAVSYMLQQGGRRESAPKITRIYFSKVTQYGNTCLQGILKSASLSQDGGQGVHGGIIFGCCARLCFSPSNTHTCRKSSEVTANRVPLKGGDSHKKNESWSGCVEWKQLLCKQRSTETRKQTCGHIQAHVRTHAAFYKSKSCLGFFYFFLLLLLPRTSSLLPRSSPPVTQSTI